MGSTLWKKRHDPTIGRERKKRSKTFKTEEAAKAYAEKNKLKDYKLVNLKSDTSKEKKIRVVVN